MLLSNEEVERVQKVKKTFSKDPSSLSFFNHVAFRQEFQCYYIFTYHTNFFVRSILTALRRIRDVKIWRAKQYRFDLKGIENMRKNSISFISNAYRYWIQ